MDFCSIASGSSGNCSFVGSGQTSILVDVGVSGKQIECGLGSVNRSAAEMDGIFITHEHSDHVRGLGVLARKYGIPIYATPGTLRAVRNCSGLGKIDPGLFHEIHADEPVQIKDMEILPFRTSHDAAESVAYRVNSGKKSVAVVTDLGIYSDYTISHLKDLDALILEANHDVRILQAGVYPYYLKQRILGDRGHLSNENAGRLLCSILHDDLRCVFLGHLSKENNYDALAYQTVCNEITMGENPYRSEDFEIRVAKRDAASELIAV